MLLNLAVFSQVFKGEKIRRPTAGFGIDTILVYSIQNPNASGEAGVLMISGTDTTTVKTDTLGNLTFTDVVLGTKTLSQLYGSGSVDDSDSLGGVAASFYVLYSDSLTTFVTPTQLRDSLSLYYLKTVIDALLGAKTDSTDFNTLEASVVADSANLANNYKQTGADTNYVNTSGDTVHGILSITGTTSIASTQNSTAKDNGALIVSGGLGVEKNVNIGANLAVTGIFGVTDAATMNTTLGVTGNTTLTGNLNANGAVTLGDALTDKVTFNSEITGGTPMKFEGNTDNDVHTVFAITDPTAERTITFPDATDTVAMLADLDAKADSTGNATRTWVTAQAYLTGSDTAGIDGRITADSTNLADNYSTTSSINAALLTKTDTTTYNALEVRFIADSTNLKDNYSTTSSISASLATKTDTTTFNALEVRLVADSTNLADNYKGTGADTSYVSTSGDIVYGSLAATDSMIIGGVTPSEILEVNGNIKTSSVTDKLLFGSTSNEHSRSLIKNSTSSGFTLQTNNTDGDVILETTGANGEVILKSDGLNGGIFFKMKGENQAKFTASGRLAIGDDLTPQSALTVFIDSLNTGDPLADFTIGYGYGNGVAAVRGENAGYDGEGYGGYFIGGYDGVFGKATPTGGDYYTGVEGLVIATNTSASTAESYGVYGVAHSGIGVNHGIYASGYGGDSANYGGYFDANGNGAENFGIYTTATGGLSNWSLYSGDGNMFVANSSIFGGASLTLDTVYYNTPISVYETRNMLNATGDSALMGNAYMRIQRLNATSGGACGITFSASNQGGQGGGAFMLAEDVGDNSDMKLHWGTKTTGILDAAVPIHMTLDEDGYLGLNTRTPESRLDIIGTSAASAGLTIQRYSDNEFGGYLSIKKSRGTVEDSYTALALNDQQGMIRTYGTDGDQFIQTSSIYGLVTGTVSDNIVPTSIVFASMNTSGSNALKMILRENGNVGIGEVNPDSTLEVNGSGHFTGNLLVDGHISQGVVYHAYGGFEDDPTTITTDAGGWHHITNATNDLWVCNEADGIMCVADSFPFVNSGDYKGMVSISFSALNTKDFHVRVYNLTQARQEGYALGISTKGANDEVNITVPLYLEITAGDAIRFEIQSDDSTNPVMQDAIFIIDFLHN